MQVRYLLDEHVEIFYMEVGKEANTVKQEYLTYITEKLKLIWDKVFKNGPSKFFKGYLPQIVLGPFLNTLFHLSRAVILPTFFHSR